MGFEVVWPQDTASLFIFPGTIKRDIDSAVGALGVAGTGHGTRKSLGLV